MNQSTLEMLGAIGAAAGIIILVLGILMFSQIVTGVMCRKLADKKGYDGYFFTGFFFGVLGLLYVIGLPDLNAKKDRRAVMKRMVNLHERVSALEGQDQEA